MKAKYIAMVLATILVFSMFLTYGFLTAEEKGNEDFSDFFVGIDVAYDDLDAIKRLIDEVSNYTNLFLIGSTGISQNSTKLDAVCQHLNQNGLYFIVYNEIPQFLYLMEELQDKCGDKFLGVEYEDEMGGVQLDHLEYKVVLQADNYSDAASQFVARVNFYLNPRLGPIEFDPKPSDFHLFTADYALYWFDYKAGYDVVLAEFGWNYSRQLNIALCRGAATVQNKDWGVIITWTYDQPPYLGSGAELYEDLIYAYRSGAKYVLIFDSNEEYSEGILSQEHFNALKHFWEYVQVFPRENDVNRDRVAYVLPPDFGYGFRGPEDWIWGLWEADDFSYEISEKLGRALEQYGTRLDIVYENGLELNGNYSRYVFWNGTILAT